MVAAPTMFFQSHKKNVYMRLHVVRFDNMRFPAKLGKRNLITIPKNIADDLELKEGDTVYIDVVKKNSVEAHKKALESPYKGADGQ